MHLHVHVPNVSSAGLNSATEVNDWFNHSILLHAVIKKAGSIDIIHVSGQNPWNSFDKWDP